MVVDGDHGTLPVHVSRACAPDAPRRLRLCDVGGTRLVTEHPTVTICGAPGPKLPLVGRPLCLREASHEGNCLGVIGRGLTVGAIMWPEGTHG